jgi:Protein of unknown function (DUF1569)
MKTVFDEATREELIQRIGLLNKNSRAQWGKMNVWQMLKHYTLWEEWMTAKETHKQIFLGRIFGKMALKSLLKDGTAMARNAPTIPELRMDRIPEQGDIEAEKEKWISQIRNYQHFTNDGFVHSFFGKMTREQVGIMAYKHADHHLRQFNC